MNVQGLAFEERFATPVPGDEPASMGATCAARRQAQWPSARGLTGPDGSRFWRLPLIA